MSAVGRELLLQLAALSRGGTEGELPTLDEVVGQLHAIVQDMQPVRDVDGSVLRANLWYGPECVALAKAIAAESRRMRGELPSAIIDAALSEVRYAPGPVRMDAVADRDGKPTFNPVVTTGPLAPMPSPHGMDTLPQIEGLQDPATSRRDGFISSPAAHPPAIEPAIHSEGVAPPTGTGIAPHVAPHTAEGLAADDPDLAITQEVERTGPAGLPPAHTRSPDLMAMEAALYGGGIEGIQVTAVPDETGSGGQVVVTQELPGPDLRAVRPEAGGTPGEPPPRPPIAILVDWVLGRLKRRGSAGDLSGGRTGPLSSRIVLALVVVLAGLGVIVAGIWGGAGSPSAPAAQAEAAVPPAGQMGDGQQKARVIDMLGPDGDGMPVPASPDASVRMNVAGQSAQPVPAVAELNEAGLRPGGSNQTGDMANGGVAAFGSVAALGQQIGQGSDIAGAAKPPASPEIAPVAPAPRNDQPPHADRNSPQSAASVNLSPPDVVAGGGKPPPSEPPAEAGSDSGQLAALVAELKQLRTEVKELKEVRRTEPGPVGQRNDLPVQAQNPKRGLGLEGRAAMGAIQRDASGAAYVSIIHGERLIDIAQRTGVPVAQLKAWNPALAAVEPQLQLGRGAVWVSAPQSSSQGGAVHEGGPAHSSVRGEAAGTGGGLRAGRIAPGFFDRVSFQGERGFV